MDQFSARFGIYVIEKGTDQSSVGLEIKSDYKNPLGAVHGGLITTLIDMAARCRGIVKVMWRPPKCDNPFYKGYRVQDPGSDCHSYA